MAEDLLEQLKKLHPQLKEMVEKKQAVVEERFSRLRSKAMESDNTPISYTSPGGFIKIEAKLALSSKTDSPIKITSIEVEKSVAVDPDMLSTYLVSSINSILDLGSAKLHDVYLNAAESTIPSL